MNLDSSIFKILAIVVHVLELSTMLYAFLYAMFHKSKSVIGFLISRFIIGLFKANIIFIISAYIFYFLRFIYRIAIFPFNDDTFLFSWLGKLNFNLSFFIALLVYITISTSIAWIIGTIIWTGSLNHIKMLINSFLPINKRLHIPQLNRLIIIKATYGANNVFIDVTDKIKKMVVNNSITITASNDLDGDPIRNVTKSLIIDYQFEGKEVQKLEIPEHTTKTIIND